MIEKALRALVIGLVAVAAPGVVTAQERGGEITFMLGPIPTLNPMGAGAATGLTSAQLYGTLVRLDENWEAQPYIAESWSASADGLTYTFNIHPEATFHDGAPITARDVKFSLETAASVHRFGSTMFGQVERIEMPDDKTAVFHLSEPNPALLRSASSPRFLPILPEHVYAGDGNFMEHPGFEMPVGSGPFRIVQNGLPEFVQVERHSDYWLDGPYLDGILFRIVTDQTAARIGFERGNFHLALAADTTNYRGLRQYQEMPNIEVTRCCGAVGSIFVLDINGRHAPLDDARVRNAISLAIDRDFIANVLHDGWTLPAVGPIVSSSPFSLDEPLPFDLDRANELLDEAGYPRGAGGIRFELSLIHTSTFRDLMVTVGEYLVPQLARVGIRVNREQMPDSASWSRRTAEWNYDLALSLPGNFHDPIVGVHRNFICSNIRNVAYTNTNGFCDERVDDLFARAGVEPDEETRIALYREVQEILVREMPMAQLLEMPAPLIHDRRIQNMPFVTWSIWGPLDQVWWQE